MIKQIKAQQLTAESFSHFGTFYDFDSRQGFPLRGDGFLYFPDKIVADSVTRVGYSLLTVERRYPLLIKVIEFHKATWEIIMPLNDDAVIHVSPPSAGKINTDESQAFIVPARTLVKINTGVWHFAPLPVNKEELQALIILPEATYMNDCFVENLHESQQFEIVI
ncbi:TPA: ureidoglycolate lyase [Salmonella enterica]